MKASEERRQSDHELISFKMTQLDKYVLYWVVIGTIVVCFALDWLTTFEGVWIWGMPRSAFGIVLVGGIANLILTAILYPAYKKQFEKMQNNK